jgi:hypothetical protein
MIAIQRNAIMLKRLDLARDLSENRLPLFRIALYISGNSERHP